MGRAQEPEHRGHPDGAFDGGQKDLAAEVLASIAEREAASAKVIERGRIVQRSALLGGTPLTDRIRFLLEMPVANLFAFLL